MNVILKNLTKEEFNNNKNPILFKDEIANNRHALITNSKLAFLMAWHSDLIEPVISEIRDSIVSVGVDQNFAIVDFKNNCIPLNLNLSYNFLDASIFRSWIFIITELEIIKADRNSFQILNEYGLPDLFQNILFKEDRIIVKCAEDISIEIS